MILKILQRYCCKQKNLFIYTCYYTSNSLSLTTVFIDTRLSKTNTCGNVSKISVNHTCYRQIGSKSTNHSPLAWRKEGLKVTLVAVIGGFRFDLSITRKTDGNFGNISVGVLFSKVTYQRKRWDVQWIILHIVKFFFLVTLDIFI